MASERESTGGEVREAMKGAAGDEQAVKALAESLLKAKWVVRAEQDQPGAKKAE